MSESVFEVVSPLGRRGGLPDTVLAPRLGSLDSRTVAFVWDHIFRGDEMFDRFEHVVRERYAGTTFVGHEAFGEIHGTSTQEQDALAELPELLRAEKVDAVVVGVGA